MRAVSIVFAFVFGYVASFERSSWGAEPAEAAIRATVRIINGPTAGTGFIVATGDPADAGKRAILVTAAHAFNDVPSDRITIVHRKLLSNKTYERRPVEVPVKGPKGPLWIRHPEQDVVVVPVDIPADVDVLPFEPEQIADVDWAEQKKIAVSHETFIPCFPVNLEANAAGFPVLRRGSIASFPLAPLASAKTILIDYSGFMGDSGSPVVVFRDDKPIVIGLISGMHRQTERTVTPSEERTVHSPLGLGIAVQSPFIRQTIDEWKKVTRVTP